MNQTTARIQFITSVVIYGTIGAVMRFIDLPSEVAVFVRGAGGCLTIVAFMLIRGIKIDFTAIRNNLLWLVLSGASLGLNWIFLFAAYEQTTLAIASLCNYTAPLMVLVVSPFIFGERLNNKQLVCVAFAVVGVVLVSGVVGSSEELVFDPLGIGLGMAAAVFFAIMVICNKRLKDIESFDRTIAQLTSASLAVLPYMLYRNGGVPLPHDVPSVLLLVVVVLIHTGLAYVFYFGGMGALPVQEVALLGYIEPVVAVLCSALILHEPLGVQGIIGAVLVLGAAAIGELVEE